MATAAGGGLAYWLLLLAAWAGLLPGVSYSLQRVFLLLLILAACPLAFFAVRSVRDVTAAALQNLAFTDDLTGLPNRAYFLAELEKALARAIRMRRQVAVLFLDLDRFKVFNDTMGHAAGDRLLAEVARRIRRQVRSGETFARLGGDEFTILLEGIATAADAEVAAKRILACLQTPFIIEGHEVFAGASIGIAVSSGESLSPDELVRRADVALYEAKAAGRACYQVFKQGASPFTVERLAFDAELRTAIEHEEFRLYYQPEVRLEDGAVVGFEALVRWQNRDRGLLPPSEFLPVAEDLGILSAIGRWVLRAACLEAASWPERCPGRLPLSVGVNVSPAEFHRRELVSEVRAVLAETGLQPSRLKLEILETALMDDHETTLETLQALRSLGVKLAIDDFGAGYSSMRYLREFPIDTLKIDRSFIAEADKDARAMAIIRSLVSLAHGLGIEVVAEGVETIPQLKLLLEANCDRAQGYLFARPMPAEALPSYVASLQHREAA
jgi:diguanylate cyclase (GGDEF)-like protein